MTDTPTAGGPHERQPDARRQGDSRAPEESQRAENAQGRFPGSDPNEGASPKEVYWKPELRPIDRPSLPTHAELRRSVRQDEIAARKPKLLATATATATAAAVAAVLLLGAWWWRLYSARMHSAVEDSYITREGEERTLTLADGSQIRMGADSALRISLSAERRLAWLLRGEAHFQVRHDESRPFSVFAGAGVITDVGTVFDVHTYSNKVVVAVSEGAVSVAPLKDSSHTSTMPPALPDAPRTSAVRIVGGEEISYDDQGVTHTRAAGDAFSVTWTEQSLVYRGRPLHEVIEDVQRYTPAHIELDPRVSDLEYTGTFIEKDADQWLRALPLIFPVDVLFIGATRIVIRPQIIDDPSPNSP